MANAHLSTFTNKNIIITGGNGGIGRAIALEFLHAGARVIILGRNHLKGVETLKMLQPHGDAMFASVDLGESEEIVRFLAGISTTHPQIDVLVNCAGAGESRGGSVKVFVDGQTRADIDERWDYLAASNLQSAYLMSALTAPRMPDGAAIVNISSTASIHGNYGLYGTFKAGLDGLTRSLAVELAPRNIRVNAISPGWIQTANTLPDAEDEGQANWAANTSLLRRMGQPHEIADATLFLASEKASFVTGTVLTVDGGLSIIDPTTESWRDVK